MTGAAPTPGLPLAGATALVTGAARGLGRAYAVRLAELGARVGVVDIDLASYEAYADDAEVAAGLTVVEEIVAAGGSALGVEADASRYSQLRRAVDGLVAELGAPTVCVCNAGGGLQARTPAEAARAIARSRASATDSAALRALVDRNLAATVATVRAVVPHIKRAGRGGSIVTVASMAALQPTLDGSFAAYGAAKAAVVTYSRYLAQELGPHGIRVNCIAPGYIATGRVRRQFEALGIETVEQRIALRRLGTVEDCTGVVEFLATPLSAYVTGTVIPVDGFCRPLG